MSEERVTTKADLLADTERDWSALQTFLQRLSPGQMTDIKNPDGWSIKDHIIHLAMWENSVVALLQGNPRHDALGVPEAVYVTHDDDTINAVIFQQQRDLSLETVLQRLVTVHKELMALVASMSDDDMMKPYAQFAVHEPGVDPNFPVMNIIYGNTAHHFRTHQHWMKEMVGM